MLIGDRNKVGLSEEEIERCVRVWDFLCGDKKRPIELSRAGVYGSRTYFDEIANALYLRADVKPGAGPYANARMSVLACLAHELAHAERFEIGFVRPFKHPDNLIDEAETSLHASSMSVLGPQDREDLVEDARDRIIEWLAQKSRG